MSEGNEIQYKNLIYMINVLFGDDAEFIIYGDYDDDMSKLITEISEYEYGPYLEYVNDNLTKRIMKNETETMLRDAVRHSISLN